MNKLYLSALAIVSVLAITWCCTKPTKDFIVNISSNVINYTATLQFVDAAQNAIIPAGLSVELDGPDAANIYDYSGTKALQLYRGTLVVGVDPKNNPTSNILAFNIKATANNYLAINKPITISATERNQNFLVKMINITNAPTGVKAIQPVATISNGTAATQVTAATTPDASTTTYANVTVPATTQFRDENNTTITGNQVRVVVASFDPASPEAMQALPGGQIQRDVAGTPTGEVFFLPAGFATVNMYINNREVRNFSAPIDIRMGINANTFNPATNAAVKAGDNLNLYSYQVQTGEWQFERTVQATTNAGRLVVDFKTDHLTTFAVCVPANGFTPCASKPYLVFNAPGINDASSDQFIVDIYPIGLGANPAPIYSQYFTIHNGDSLQLTDLPSGNVEIRVSKVDYDHYLLSDYRNRGTSVGGITSLNLCGAVEPVPVNINYSGNNYLKGTGYAVCPNDNSRRYLPPDGAQVYFRKSGTSDDFRIMGVIVKAALTTTMVTPGERYDFQGNYGGKRVGGNNILIRQGVSFLDSIHVIVDVANYCP